MIKGILLKMVGISTVTKQFLSKAAGLEHSIYLLQKRKRLINKTPSILSSNCNGSIILHDMGCRYNSPTVNLFFTPTDFIKLLKEPEYYLKVVPEEIHISGITYPVGSLDDIRVYFMHYDSFEAARNKWLERSQRVNFNNMYIIMTERDGCTYENLEEFDSLHYKNKIVFTSRPYPEFKSSYYIPGSEKGKEVGILSDLKPGILQRRWLDDFDYVRWLNEGMGQVV